MASLYVLGARQKDLLLRHEREWNLYEAALILQLDTETGAVRTCIEYQTPPEARANEKSSNVFKSGTLVGDTLYACTSTEVLIFKLPEFQRIGYVSLPCFNDLHHVTPTSNGDLLAAVTGLDMVVRFNREGEQLEEWSVLPEAPWSRFSRDIDYRKIETTKPHKSHPNFVFELNGEIWATRFSQRDAICLNDPEKRIDIAVQSPHDGLLFGERIYFTSVDGRVIIADPRSLQVEKIIDLKQIDGQDALLGWCRGLLPLDESRVWVGFTQIRKTRFRENVLWVKRAFREGMSEKPTHITLYDIVNNRRIQEFDLEAHGMNLVFSIFPAIPSRPQQPAGF
ncbi:MAG: hypothetical protein ABSG72_04515 [Candidatus Sulfotelmatobacter sp.]|jgi:hypothetical protein